MKKSMQNLFFTFKYSENTVATDFTKKLIWPKVFGQTFWVITRQYKIEIKKISNCWKAL